MALAKPKLPEPELAEAVEPRLLACSGAELVPLAEALLQKGFSFRMRAHGFSMGRTIRHGELIEVAPCRAADLRAGAVAFYQLEGLPAAHRIIRRREEGGALTFVLRGDTLGGSAEAVPAEAVLGRVVAVYRGGRWEPLSPGAGWCLFGRLKPRSARLARSLIRRTRAVAAPGRRAGAARRLTYELLTRCAVSPEASVERAEEPFDWEGWLELVQREGLGGLFGYWCRADERWAAAVPEAARGRLIHLYYETAASNTRSLSRVASVIERLRQAGVEAVVLKGAHLAEAVYPSVGCRPMGDVDLLTRPGDFHKASGALAGLGYEMTCGPEPGAAVSAGVTLNTSQWHHPDPSYASIHLHWHLRNTTLPYGLVTAVDDERLWADAQQFELAGRPALGLAPHHLLLHLADHAAVHRYDRLLLLADMAAVAKRCGDELDWPLLVDEARAFGLASSLAMSLHLAARYAAAPVPRQVSDDLSSVRLSRPERRLVERFERYRGSIFWGWLVYWSRCPTWMERLRFLWLTVRPERTRLALQSGGPASWRGYLAFSLRRIAASRRLRQRSF